MNSIWTYHELLPTVSADFRLSLGEGNTPLIRSKSIGKTLGIPALYFKLENLNPTGSYKDRFAAMFVSILQSRNIKTCIATSSGNTGAALAAYCAAAKIKCVLAIVDGAPAAKIRQIQLYGAATFMIKDFGKHAATTKEVFDFLEETAASLKIPLPVSAYRYCEDGMQGVETISYEILKETNHSTDHIFCPAGGGGLVLAIARGCRKYRVANSGNHSPKVNCVQPEGNDTIASPLREKKELAVNLDRSTTSISGLQVPGVLDGNEVLKECRYTNGNGYVVTDEDVYHFQRKLAMEEGIFCEPAGAVALAGLSVAVRKKEVRNDEKIVCLVTGSGFKDMSAVENRFHLPGIEKVENINSILDALTINNQKANND